MKPLHQRSERLTIRMVTWKNVLGKEGSYVRSCTDDPALPTKRTLDDSCGNLETLFYWPVSSLLVWSWVGSHLYGS